MIKEKKKKPHYVDNKQFYAAIVKWKENCKLAEQEFREPPQLNDYIGSCISKIAEQLSTKACFVNYSFREEMVEDGIENCIMYFKDFDPNKTQNPFAYFSKIIWFAFLRRIGKEEKLRYTKYKYFQENFVNTGDTNFLIDGDNKHIIPVTMYDNIAEFMERFEMKEKKKKQKRKESKELLKAANSS
jgi:hypothetical protein